MRNITLHIIALIAIVTLGANNILAQNFTVTGTVINAETGVAVEFANIGVEGTYLGTASDLNGNFEIILSQALADKFISISAVGYKSKRYVVGDWSGKDELIIQLAPTNYGISEVNVAAKSKVGYGIIRTASNLISENYVNEPYTLKCYVQKNKAGINEEAIISIADKSGYGKRSFTEAFQNVNYKITQNKPQKEIVLFKDGLTLIDQLIAQDIIRHPGNILSVESINDFDVKQEAEEVMNGEKVWVLSYTCKKPTIQNTGDPEIIEFSGTIHIAQNNNVVLKNTVKAIRKGKFRHGTSFSNPADSDKELQYEVETYYKKHQDKYIVHSIHLIQEYLGKKESVWLKVVEVLPFDKGITGRQYFNNTPKDESFWKNYKRPE